MFSLLLKELIFDFDFCTILLWFSVQTLLTLNVIKDDLSFINRDFFRFWINNYGSFKNGFLFGLLTYANAFSRTCTLTLSWLYLMLGFFVSLLLP